MNETLEKVLLAAANLTSGKSQDELKTIWSSADVVQSENEIHGEWIWEKSTPGFMELIITLAPEGKGTYFNSGNGGGFHDPIFYSVENSFLSTCKEENINEGYWKKNEIRMTGDVLLVSDSEEIMVYLKR